MLGLLSGLVLGLPFGIIVELRPVFMKLFKPIIIIAMMAIMFGMFFWDIRNPYLEPYGEVTIIRGIYWGAGVGLIIVLLERWIQALIVKLLILMDMPILAAKVVSNAKPGSRPAERSTPATGSNEYLVK